MGKKALGIKYTLKRHLKSVYFHAIVFGRGNTKEEKKP